MTEIIGAGLFLLIGITLFLLIKRSSSRRGVENRLAYRLLARLLTEKTRHRERGDNG